MKSCNVSILNDDNLCEYEVLSGIRVLWGQPQVVLERANLNISAGAGESYIPIHRCTGN